MRQQPVARFATVTSPKRQPWPWPWPSTADHPQFCIVGAYTRFSLRSQLQKVAKTTPGTCAHRSNTQDTRRKRLNKTPPSGRGGVWTYPRTAGVRGTRSGPSMLRRPQVHVSPSRHGQGHQPGVMDLRASGEHTPRTPPVNVVSPRAPAPPCRGSLVVAGKPLPVFVDDSALIPRNVPAGSGVLAGYPLLADFEINPAGLGIVKMSRLQNVDLAVLPKSHFSGRL